eukprot:6044221-Ditylum_brightwellii.AAC.1
MVLMRRVGMKGSVKTTIRQVFDRSHRALSFWPIIHQNAQEKMIIASAANAASTVHGTIATDVDIATKNEFLFAVIAQQLRLRPYCSLHCLDDVVLRKNATRLTLCIT